MRLEARYRRSAVLRVRRVMSELVSLWWGSRIGYGSLRSPLTNLEDSMALITDDHDNLIPVPEDWPCEKPKSSETNLLIRIVHLIKRGVAHVVKCVWKAFRDGTCFFD